MQGYYILPEQPKEKTQKVQNCYILLICVGVIKYNIFRTH